jgi:hypothetical protein
MADGCLDRLGDADRLATGESGAGAGWSRGASSVVRSSANRPSLLSQSAATGERPA